MANSSALAPIYRVGELREIEAASASLPLMERAGAAAAGVARAWARQRGGAVLVLAGPGNNGGDALVVARLLRDAFFDVAVVFRGDAAKLPPDAAAAHRAFVDSGGSTVADYPERFTGSLIVDGLFGIGLARPLASADAALVERANASGIPILALDIPSGLDAETGVAMGAAIRARATATFIALKPGLLTADAVDLAGEISVHSLGLDPEAASPAHGHRLDWKSLAAALPPALTRRERNVHKGTYGTLGIVGGTEGMIGAPLLAGRAALHAGAGKVLVGFAGDAHPAIDWGQPELMLRHASAVLDAAPDALVCGPGLGTAAAARSIVARAIATTVPLVLDADALNIIASDSALAAAVAARGAPTIATPHPAEAARLLRATSADVQKDRLAAAQTLATELNVAVVVKGAGSVLAYPDGKWDINTTGNPGLASGGTGDVLAGFVGAMLAQRIEAVAALRIAVCVHGAAADACIAAGTGPLGLTASELMPMARSLLNAR
ncbi:MAG TPA: NAD(P)H-hydrate dehydratase [Casimicrobiaceae bacterium]|nr:NAD(P)H-hydrate dehydratase [Casimicrobiaceae bacterium]